MNMHKALMLVQSTIRSVIPVAVGFSRSPEWTLGELHRDLPPAFQLFQGRRHWTQVPYEGFWEKVTAHIAYYSYIQITQLCPSHRPITTVLTDTSYSDFRLNLRTISGQISHPNCSFLSAGSCRFPRLKWISSFLAVFEKRLELSHLASTGYQLAAFFGIRQPLRWEFNHRSFLAWHIYKYGGITPCISRIRARQRLYPVHHCRSGPESAP